MSPCSWFLPFLLVSLMLPVSCGRAELRPRPVAPLSDICPDCLMTVGDSGYAVEFVGRDGTVLVFDDPGCLILYRHDRGGDLKDGALFIQDARSKEWLPWDKAFFVDAPSVPSPMMYGLHAFGTESAARDFVSVHDGARLIPAASLDARMTSPK